jgi:2-hydroxychromene-2-carboxylate isomerase
VPRLDFWYELASTYSYPAAMRIEAAAASAGVEIRWRPFLLGPIFRAQGWADTPFNLLPGKGRYMQRDLQRVCAALGLPFRMPERFPCRSVMAARVALVGLDPGWGIRFSHSVYRAEFGAGADIGERGVLARILEELGLDAERTLAEAESTDNKARLRTETDEAERLGIFGAPSFVTADGELFWGNDRLEAALAWQRDLV